jgi:hypothetical protein
MREWLRTVHQVLMGLLRRFLANAPSNSYEQIVFGAFRSMASNFGRGVA